MAVSCMSTSAVYVAIWRNLSCREDDDYDEYDSYGNRVHYYGNSDGKCVYMCMYLVCHNYSNW